jgi:8-oxo-dGTP diphosphatase
VELYYVDREYVSFIGNVEQLSWFHVSGPMAVEALSRNPHLTGRLEAETGWLEGAQALLSQFDPVSRMFRDRIFAEAGLTEPVFPTAYGCMALREVEKWITMYDGIKEQIAVPPPENADSTIRKAGAAIIRDGHLLLVRKFGTNQLIMPGGGVERGEEPAEALKRELLEELGVKETNIEPKPIGVYCARAAFEAGMSVEITLYRADVLDTPQALGEIEELIWYGPANQDHHLSPIVAEKIIPSLKGLGIL